MMKQIEEMEEEPTKEIMNNVFADAFLVKGKEK